MSASPNCCSVVRVLCTDGETVEIGKKELIEFSMFANLIDDVGDQDDVISLADIAVDTLFACTSADLLAAVDMAADKKPLPTTALTTMRALTLVDRLGHHDLCGRLAKHAAQNWIEKRSPAQIRQDFGLSADSDNNNNNTPRRVVVIPWKEDGVPTRGDPPVYPKLDESRRSAVDMLLSLTDFPPPPPQRY